MARAIFRRTARRAIERHGRDVRLVNFSESYDSDTGDQTWTPLEIATFPAIVTEPRDPQTGADARGTDSEADAELWIRDDDVDDPYGTGAYGEGTYSLAAQYGLGVYGAGPYGGGRRALLDDEAGTHQSVIRDLTTYQEYLIMEIHDEDNGLIKATAVER